MIFGLNVVIFCKRSQQQARLDEAMLLIPPRTELWERLQTTSCNISLFYNNKIMEITKITFLNLQHC